MDNPYADQEYYADAWQQGYDYGAENPDDTDPTPPDFSEWGLDEAMTSNVQQVWLEGALAGRGEASPTLGYDANTDTFVGRSDDFPGFTLMAQCADIDEWLTQIGIDPAIFSDEPVG